MNYGQVPKDADTLLDDACPIVGSYGAGDRSLRDAPARVERVLAGHGIAHDVRVHPEAGHAFLNDHDPAEMSRGRWSRVRCRTRSITRHPPMTRAGGSLRSSTPTSAIEDGTADGR